MNSDSVRNRVLKIGSGMLVLALAGGLVGCQGHGVDPRAGRVPAPPTPPAAYPAAKDVALDPQLRNTAEQELVAGLHAPDAEVRAHALEAVRNTEGKARSAEILAALSDPDPLVRYGACLAAGELELHSAHDTLLRLAGDKDSAVRVVARFALHRLGDYRYSHELETLSRDPEPRVRGTTAMVLGMIGDRTALRVLRTMRFDANPAVRQQASAAMWQLGSRQGLEDLVGWSISRYPDDEMIGLQGLAAPRNRDVIQHVRAALTSDWPEVTLTAARAMGMLGSDEGYGIALKGVASKDPRDRIQAALALGAIGRSDSQDALRRLANDSDPNVRIAAAQAILQLKPQVASGQ